VTTSNSTAPASVGTSVETRLRDAICSLRELHTRDGTVDFPALGLHPSIRALQGRYSDTLRAFITRAASDLVSIESKPHSPGALYLRPTQVLLDLVAERPPTAAPGADQRVPTPAAPSADLTTDAAVPQLLHSSPSPPVTATPAVRVAPAPPAADLPLPIGVGRRPPPPPPPGRLPLRLLISTMVDAIAAVRNLRVALATAPAQDRWASAVTLDTEFDDDGLALLQLCYATGDGTTTTTLLVDLAADRTLVTASGLQQVLEDALVIKVVHSAREDVERLGRDVGVRLAPVLDTQEAHALLRGARPDTGLNDLLRAWGQPLNHHKDAVRERMRTEPSLWRRRPLTEELQAYCALDVEPLLGAYRAMRADVIATGNEARWTALLRTPPAAAVRAAPGAVAATPMAARVAPMTDWHVVQQNHQTSVLGMDGAAYALLADEDALLSVLPAAAQAWFDTLDDAEMARVVDVALDVGRPIQVKLSLPEDEQRTDAAAAASRRRRFEVRYADSVVLTQDDVNAVVAAVEAPADATGRMIVPRTLHRLGLLRDFADAGSVVGLTCRFGRAYAGLAEALAPDLLDNLRTASQSLLIVGPPGSGKTSTLRDLVRCLAAPPQPVSVMVVDPSMEIGGGGVQPHASIGGARRLLVPPGITQSKAMLEAVTNHTPEVLVVDEIVRSAQAPRSPPSAHCLTLGNRARGKRRACVRAWPSGA
jgi:stage III sporulation protein SpoIIIAA